jgi:predicted ATPase/DNA-binding NarL/FixJ family response regulator
MPHAHSPLVAFPQQPSNQLIETPTPNHNLPASPTPLVGREEELASVVQMLRRPDVRLLTLIGPPGIGKTRLSIQAASTLLDTFPHGLFFVPLAPITDPDLVIPTIAQVVGAKEVSGQPLLKTLQAYLKDKGALLLLDNFEQVLEAGPLLAELLAACLALKVLVTSRELLHLYGEHGYPVPPLPVPSLRDSGKPPDLEALSRYEAVVLFVQRAQSVNPNFQLTDHNASPVAEICLRLDGLPLAIELAAARSLVLPPEELLGRLDSRFKLLTGGARNLPERQRTLQAAIDWSYNLLEPEEQALFRTLGVFVGGSTLQAIDAVCGSEHGIDTLDGVASLVGKSLLQRQEGIAGEPRFAMLETIREYAKNKLVEGGQDVSTHGRHADYFTRFVHEAAAELFASKKQSEWLNRIDQELGNLRAAVEWSLAHGRAETAASISSPLLRFWFIRGRLSEARKLHEQVLAARDTLHAPTLARVLESAGSAAAHLGDGERAQEWLGESLSMFRQLGDMAGIARALNMLGISANVHGDYERATALWEESLALRQELGDKVGVAQCLMNLSEPLIIKGDYEKAHVVLEESRALWQGLGDEIGVSLTISGLADVALHQGEGEQAEILARQSLAQFHTLRSVGHTVDALHLLAAALALQGKTEQALRLFAAVEVLGTSSADRIEPVDPAFLGSVLSAARARAGEKAFATLWAEGLAMSLEEAMAYALDPGSTGALEPGGSAEIPTKRPPTYPDDLTEREVEVLRLIAAGKSNQEISAELVLSLRTVERHISNIYVKIGASGRIARATATAYALRQGLTT